MRGQISKKRDVKSSLIELKEFAKRLYKATMATICEQLALKREGIGQYCSSGPFQPKMRLKRLSEQYNEPKNLSDPFYNRKGEFKTKRTLLHEDLSRRYTE